MGLRKEILDIISDNLYESVSEKTELHKFDLFDILEVIYEVEKKYKCKIDDYDIASTAFNTVKDLIDFCIIYIKK